VRAQLQAVPSLAEVPLQQLRATGVRGLLLDLDNTLVPARTEAVTPEAERFLAQARSLGMQGIIVSNGRRQRAQRIAASLGLPAVGRAKKPFPGGYRRALRHLDLQVCEVAAVGDQMLTDGVGGWLQGVKVFLVEPLSREESLLVQLGRPADRVLRRLLVRRAAD